MSIQITPFHNELLPQAGELLAQRHRSDRVSLPELPSRFEVPTVACQAIQASLRRQRAGGFAALENGKLVAYLIGDMVIDSQWGRTAWVRSAGCAYASEAGVEIIRDLYAALGARWVGYGLFSHIVQIPITDPALIHAWFLLSFGIEQIHALADLEALHPVMPSLPPDIEIRKAGLADRQHLADMSDVIWRQNVKAPVWAAQMPETTSDNREIWASQVDESDVTVWLAVKKGKVVGIQGYWPAESAVTAAEDNLFIPEKCAHMSLAGTRAEERGKGVSTLLTKYVLAQTRALSYRFCDTDWRSTNLLASRFWPRQGYRPVTYRLVRRIDQRIAWADGSVPE
jgi:GNAT superfamily N-acetyltransferase